MAHNLNKIIIAAYLFSGIALAASGNPENPDASTKNWQLDELRQSMNDQYGDLSDRIDQIGEFDASGIYERLDGHDKQIGALGDAVADAQNTANTASDKADQAIQKNIEQDHRLDALDNGLNAANDRMDLLEDGVEHNKRVAEGAADMAQEAKDLAVDAKAVADQATRDNRVQDDRIAELQKNKADRSELEEVAIKADGALAGSVENRNQIDAVKENLADTNKQVNNNKQDIQKVKNDVQVVSRDVANNGIRIQRNEERIDGAYAGIYDNRANIEANRQAISRNSHEIQKLNKNFSDLKNKVDANRKRAAAGIAGVAAMANIPEVNSHQTFSVGAGVGGFDGQQAIAVGASARINDNVTVKASVAANNEEVVWGAGTAIGW
nr:MAG TPA: YadA-like membrane anchor domain protein [Caudoviricetes sp.]